MPALRIAFVVTGLGMGGAEHALLQLLARFDRSRVQPEVVVLGREDALAARFEAAGITPHFLGLRAGRWPLSEIGRYLHVLRTLEPALIQGWMYHGNLAASFAAARLCVPACWSVRDTPDAAHGHSRFTRAVIALSRLYAGRTLRIFNVSRRSADYCARHLRWPAERIEVLPNGIDTQRFRPAAEVHASLRESLQLPAGAAIVGMVARYAPVKDHALFLSAAQLLRARVPHAHFVLVGNGCDAHNAGLGADIARHDLAGAISLLGARHDVEALVPGFDVATLTSRSEGFPNVLAEAMACAVPVVSTDVGDAREIVGDTGEIVARSPEALADAWDALLRDPQRAARGERGRARIAERYALDAVSEGLQARYEALLAARRM